MKFVVLLQAGQGRVSGLATVSIVWYRNERDEKES